MQKHLFKLSLLLLLCSIQLSNAKPIFKQHNYLIGCKTDYGSGVVGIGVTTPDLYYPMAFYPQRDNETALDEDYWIIKEEADGEYSFQNAVTMQYIKHDLSAPIDRIALVLADELESDKSTLFSLELKQDGEVAYYTIRSVAYSVKGWNKRSIVEGMFPLGVYNISGSNNECFVFYTSDGERVVDDYQVPVDEPDAGPNLAHFKNTISTLTFAHKVPVANKDRNEFFISIAESKIGSKLVLPIHFKLVNPNHKLVINGSPAVDGLDFNFGVVKAGVPCTIEVMNGSAVVSAGTIVFSSLPLVQLYYDSYLSSSFSMGKFVVTEPDTLRPAEVLLSNLRYRGATALGQSKKSFAVKLKSSLDGVTKINRSFLGYRNDNYWILDAMAIDPGRIRNRVSTDFWNDFATAPYFKEKEPTLRNGTRGSYVEVFINDSYNGLYCMTEKIDRKQLDLKRFKLDSVTNEVTQRGGLYKAKQWTVGTLLGNGNYGSRNGVLASVPNFNNRSETWSSFEVKYPDYGDGEEIDWKPLYDAVMISSHHTSDADFATYVQYFYDLPVFIDYYLFIELLLATDNHGKNTYLSVYNQTKSPMITITPWDLDGTWGRRWEGSASLTYAEQPFIDFINKHEHMENNLYIRLRELDYDNYNTKLRNRYNELRGTHFDHEKIMNRFAEYYRQFEKSGADMREIMQWRLRSFDDEYIFLSDWVQARLDYLDVQYLGEIYSSIDERTTASLQVYPTPTQGQLTISNVTSGQMVEIVSLQGKVMTQIIPNSTQIVTNIGNYPSGVYMVKTGGYSTKIVKL